MGGSSKRMSMCMSMRGTTMLDDFFTRALIAGIALSLVTGPLGCFIVWRRMSYFGDTMAHSALLGVALSFLFDVNLTFGVFVVACATDSIDGWMARSRSPAPRAQPPRAIPASGPPISRASSTHRRSAP